MIDSWRFLMIGFVWEILPLAEYREFNPLNHELAS